MTTEHKHHNKQKKKEKSEETNCDVLRKEHDAKSVNLLLPLAIFVNVFIYTLFNMYESTCK